LAGQNLTNGHLVQCTASAIGQITICLTSFSVGKAT
jgi:hypothetical protein